MKKIILILLTFGTLMSYAQENKNNILPQVNVTGEGKIKVTPDQAVISLGVENTGKDAAEVKKANDIIIEKIIKYIKAHNIATADFQTTNVSLYKNYDYEKKKYNYVANQSVTVTLKDLKTYDEFMMDITQTGITNIRGIEFKSSKIEEHESQARKKAMLLAKQKATDYAIVLNQKIGKAILVTDNSQSYYPQPVYRSAMLGKGMMADESAPRETLAIGEIEITATVQVTFLLE